MKTPALQHLPIDDLLPYARNAKIGKYMIGMSVPPKMAEAVARAVIDQWLLPE